MEMNDGDWLLQVQGVSPGATMPHKAFSFESLLPPSPQVAGALGQGKRMGWIALGDEMRLSGGRVECREVEGDRVLPVQGQDLG